MRHAKRACDSRALGSINLQNKKETSRNYDVLNARCHSKRPAAKRCGNMQRRKEAKRGRHQSGLRTKWGHGLFLRFARNVLIVARACRNISRKNPERTPEREGLHLQLGLAGA